MRWGDAWENTYDVTVTTKSGKIYKYDIEADTAIDAERVTREFFADDYPNEIIAKIKIRMGV